LQVAFRAAFFVGPLLLAPLLAIASMGVVLALDALTFIVSAATLAAIRVGPARPAGERLGLRDDLAAGLAAVRREPEVMIVVGTFVLALVAASGFLTVGVVALVGEGLGGQAGELGLLLGIAGVAEVFGALALARLRLPLRNLALIAVLAWALLGVFRFPLWEAGIAGAVALAPVIAATTIDHLGVTTGFMLSGAALILIGTAAALLLTRTAPGRVHGPALQAEAGRP
jgi:hypothetical protein